MFTHFVVQLVSRCFQTKQLLCNILMTSQRNFRGLKVVPKKKLLKTHIKTWLWWMCVFLCTRIKQITLCVYVLITRKGEIDFFLNKRCWYIKDCTRFAGIKNKLLDYVKTSGCIYQRKWWFHSAGINLVVHAFFAGQKTSGWPDLTKSSARVHFFLCNKKRYCLCRIFFISLKNLRKK